MHQRFIDLLEEWLYPKLTETAILVLLISSLLFFSYAAVLYTGGTYFGFLHLFYLPIVIAGFFFSIRGGLLVGFVSSILVGPLMPLVVVNHIMQPTYSWGTRSVFFLLIGALSGLGSSVFRAYLKELKKRYLTNSVTGLPNFLGLEAEFHNKVKNNVKNMSLIVIDLRNINEIEIAIGPLGIDQLLNMVANDLRKGLPADIILGHTQVSVFNLLVEDPTQTDDIVERCQRYLNSTYLVEHIPIFVEGFFGISRYPEDDDNFSGLFKKARMAINFGAKQAKILARYDINVVDHSGENVVLLTELNEAIENDKLDIHYQPKIDLKNGKVHGMEALARWTHPVKGEIEPGKFIPLTERTMLINPFTKWMLERTFKDMASWQREGMDLSLAVNFSLRNFHDHTIIEKVLELVERYKLDPKKIEIEVTESAFSMNMNEIIQTLKYLRENGLRISIDDFGTGQASQQYLFQLPIDGLKIDQIFVGELGHNSAAEAIVNNAISLGHQLGLEVIAEGIETQAQYDLLAKLGCDQGQGYLISAPIPFDELMLWLKSERRYAIS